MKSLKDKVRKLKKWSVICFQSQLAEYSLMPLRLRGKIKKPASGEAGQPFKYSVFSRSWQHEKFEG
ncbi:hypothetical protein DDT91_17095 [Algoriphagus sp. AK58]|nr:hypothetical protein [Algoriphagus sp. AK58]